MHLGNAAFDFHFLDQQSEVKVEVVDEKDYSVLHLAVAHVDLEMDFSAGVERKSAHITARLEVVKLCNLCQHVHWHVGTVVSLDSWEELVHGGGVQLDWRRRGDVGRFDPEPKQVVFQEGGNSRISKVVAQEKLEF